MIKRFILNRVAFILCFAQPFFLLYFIMLLYLLFHFFHFFGRRLPLMISRLCLCVKNSQSVAVVKKELYFMLFLDTLLYRCYIHR